MWLNTRQGIISYNPLLGTCLVKLNPIFRPLFEMVLAIAMALSSKDQACACA